METGVTCYKMWLPTVGLLGGTMGEAVSFKGASMIGMWNSSLSEHHVIRLELFSVPQVSPISLPS